MHLKKVPRAEDVVVQTLVEETDGFSGAEVVAAISEATMLAIDEGAQKVSMRHYLEAARAIKPQITEEMKAFYSEITHQLCSRKSHQN